MNTITPAELIAVLNIASKAPTTVGDAFLTNATFIKLVALANQPHPIGAIVPSADSGSASSDSASEA